jgi:sugar lactone lactonase YvrE
VTPRLRATGATYVHAEGPFWDAPRNRLLWVDILQGLVLVGVLDERGDVVETDRVPFPHMVGAVAPADDGSWIVAGQDGVLVREPGGAISSGPALLPSGSGRRLNDGKPDPQGRYLVGTLPLEGSSTTEELYLLDHGTVRVLDADLTLSNGLAWSADGSLFYSVDSERRTVFRRGWGPDGPVGPRETFVVLEAGYPDGMTIDAEEHLWVAVWGSGELHRYDPGGRLVDTVTVPAPHTSSVAFAGDGLRTLVITTSVKDLAPDQLGRYPDSGRLFTLETDVPGLPQPLWAGPVSENGRRR